MAEEKKHKEHHTPWQSLNNWVTALTAFPVAGLVLKEVSEIILKKGAEKLQQKVGEILGTLDQAKKDPTDEILHNCALYSMSEEKDWKEIEVFMRRFRSEKPEKAEAFVFYIAKTVLLFERDVTETNTPKKGSGEPKIQVKYKDIKAGIEETHKFLRAFLEEKGDDDEKTYLQRIAFLEGKNVFSTIPAEPHLWVKKAKEKSKEFAAKKTKEIIKGEKANRKSFAQFAADLRAKSKAHYEKVKAHN